jgi:hypothetical protein
MRWTIRDHYDPHREANVHSTEDLNAFGGSPFHVNFAFGVRIGR